MRESVRLLLRFATATVDDCTGINGAMTFVTKDDVTPSVGCFLMSTTAVVVAFVPVLVGGVLVVLVATITSSRLFRLFLLPLPLSF